MAHGFQGLEGQVMPEMPQDFVDEITKRYVDLYEKITGSSFVFGSTQCLEDDIQDAVVDYLSS